MSVQLDKKYIEENFVSALKNLSEKERVVLENRTGINWERLTLQSIWNSFSPSITRERVRQIEESWIEKLKRIIVNIPTLQLIQKKARELIELNWGLITKTKLINELIKDLKLDSKINSYIIEFVVQAQEWVFKSKPRLGVDTYFYLSDIHRKLINEIHKEAVKILKKKKEPIRQIALYEQIRKNLDKDISLRFINSVLDIFHDIVKWEEDLIALEKWKILNPKTLKDKTIYVLKKEKVPMHFIDIANKISEYLWDKVKVNTIHNELIRNNNFVLIGRWIYALKEWWFKSGTVIAVIIDILRKKWEPMSTEEITKAVLKVRKVRPSTVYMNLQNRDVIDRVWRNYYYLKDEYKA